jgi:Na+-transporting methylmalonyl-CoA/oxaloacetate decarboxylase gamma subunit
MTRGVGMIVVLLSLVLVGGLYAMQSKSQGPTAPAVTQDETQALVAASAQTFAQVDQVLQADFAQNGTYAGAELPVGSGVTLALATQTAYCLEANVSGTLVHESGPGGSPAPGPC